MSDQWLTWAKEIAATAQAGLAFTKDPFDKERYEELQKLSAEIMSTYSSYSMEKIEGLFSGQRGYPTPKVDVRGVVFSEGKLLLVKEEVDGRWSLPGGFCDINLSPSENVTKEIREESGYLTEAVKLLAVLDYHKHPHPPIPFHYYKLFIQCDVVGGEAESGLETADVGFFTLDGLPELSVGRNTESQIALLFEFLKDPAKETVFD
jgi:ADP-ribose pyrophosphatase YjhB (NUDIX family)